MTEGAISASSLQERQRACLIASQPSWFSEGSSRKFCVIVAGGHARLDLTP